MKNLLLATLSICFVELHAQSEFNFEYNWTFSQAQHEPVFYQPLEKVEKINFTLIKKNGKEKHFYKEYNQEGRLVKYAKLNKEKEIIPVLTFSYDENQMETGANYFKRGKLKKSMEKKYNADKIKTEVIYKKGNGKIISRDTWNYGDGKCLVSSERYKGNSNKLKRKWEYTYYEDCKKKQTSLYNGKGKLLQVWNHECKEEGEQLAKSKKETQICRWEESTDNYLIKVYQSFSDRGKIIKTVAKYTKADTLLVEYKHYNGKDELISESSYDPNIQKITSYTSYRKGKIRSQNKYEYQSEMLVNKRYLSRGKLNSELQYNYDDRLLTELKEFGKNKSVVKTIKLSY